MIGYLPLSSIGIRAGSIAANLYDLAVVSTYVFQNQVTHTNISLFAPNSVESH
jgi:hypothetical protein